MLRLAFIEARQLNIGSFFIVGMYMSEFSSINAQPASPTTGMNSSNARRDQMVPDPALIVS
jgi:hypothetical protein